jgi:hypothetical protein
VTHPTLFTPQVLQTRTGERLTLHAEWWWIEGKCAHPSTDWCRFSVRSRWNPDIEDPHQKRAWAYVLEEEA